MENWLNEVAKPAGKSSPLLASRHRTPPTLRAALKTYVETNFTYDGRSSDLALQYLMRYAADDDVDQLKIQELPNEIQDRLAPLGLSFRHLDGL